MLRSPQMALLAHGLGHLPSELASAIKKVYEPAGMSVTNPKREAEGAEYGASRLSLNNHTIAFRVAKTTPTKIGQFVTIWKRPSAGAAIVPLNASDGISLVVVSVSDAKNHGQFVFNQKTLIEQGIMASSNKKGKLAIRIYPPWSKPVAKDAIKTQKWQLQHFLSITSDGTADMKQVGKLFSTILPKPTPQNLLASLTKPAQGATEHKDKERDEKESRKRKTTSSHQSDATEDEPPTKQARKEGTPKPPMKEVDAKKTLSPGAGSGTGQKREVSSLNKQHSSLFANTASGHSHSHAGLQPPKAERSVAMDVDGSKKTIAKTA